MELYFSAFYAVNQLVLCTVNKLDNKIGFITQGGSNQEFTLGLEVFLKLAFSFVVMKVKTLTDFLITGCVLVACIGISYRTAFNPVLAVNMISPYITFGFFLVCGWVFVWVSFYEILCM